MENSKIILLIFSIIFFTSCKNGIDEKKKIYIPIFEDVLFKDNKGNILIKIEDNSFSSDIAVLNHKNVQKIKNIVDLTTFHRIKNTRGYYYDKNRVYALQSDKKASFPKFIEIDIDKDKLVVIDSLTIKDDFAKYVEGFCENINNTNP